MCMYAEEAKQRHHHLFKKKEQLGDGTKWYHQILYESIGLDISDKVG